MSINQDQTFITNVKSPCLYLGAGWQPKKAYYRAYRPLNRIFWASLLQRLTRRINITCA